MDQSGEHIRRTVQGCSPNGHVLEECGQAFHPACNRIYQTSSFCFDTLILISAPSLLASAFQTLMEQSRDDEMMCPLPLHLTQLMAFV